MMNHPLIDKVVAMYQSGSSIEEIAKETQFSFSYIYNILRFEKIEIRK